MAARSEAPDDNPRPAEPLALRDAYYLVVANDPAGGRVAMRLASDGENGSFTVIAFPELAEAPLEGQVSIRTVRALVDGNREPVVYSVRDATGQRRYTWPRSAYENGSDVTLTVIERDNSAEQVMEREVEAERAVEPTIDHAVDRTADVETERTVATELEAELDLALEEALDAPELEVETAIDEPEAELEPATTGKKRRRRRRTQRTAEIVELEQAARSPLDELRDVVEARLRDAESEAAQRLAYAVDLAEHHASESRVINAVKGIERTLEMELGIQRGTEADAVVLEEVGHALEEAASVERDIAARTTLEHIVEPDTGRSLRREL